MPIISQGQESPVITCVQFADSLPVLLNNEISQKGQLALTAHLAGCKSCLKDFENYRQVIELARDLKDFPLPAHIKSRINTNWLLRMSN